MDSSLRAAWYEPSIATSLLEPFVQLRAALPPRLTRGLDALPATNDQERLPLLTFLDWLERASELLQDPGLGLRALAHLTRGTGGVVEFGAGSAATLGDALNFLSGHVRILNEAADFQLWTDGDLASFELRTRVKLGRALRDFQAGAILFALEKWVGGMGDAQVWFSYREPRDSALHRSLFAPSAVRFDAPCDAIVFRASRLSEPLRSADAPLHSVLADYAGQLVREQNDEDTLVPRVREVLFDLLPRGGSDAGEISKRFGMSRRTLTRHLAREGVNFRQLLEEVRHQRALRYLETTNLELSRVAKLLGYTETTSFCRAFIRWRGQSPLTYRRACRAERSTAN
jgi:AraC-like DNA-binding protein